MVITKQRLSTLRHKCTAGFNESVHKTYLSDFCLIRLIQVEKELDYSPPRIYYDSFHAPDLYSFEPQSHSRSRTITVKTTLYDVKSSSNVWTLTTETANPPTARALARSLSKTVTDIMDEKGFIRRPATQK